MQQVLLLITTLCLLITGNYTTVALSQNVAYRQHNLEIKSSLIPLAVWYPTNQDSIEDSASDKTATATATYPYAISIRRIVKLLIGSSFLPDFKFLVKDINVVAKPSSGSFKITQCSGGTQEPKNVPIVLACHGYLGSRFDLHHICSALASKGSLSILAISFIFTFFSSYLGI